MAVRRALGAEKAEKDRQAGRAREEEADDAGGPAQGLHRGSGGPVRDIELDMDNRRLGPPAELKFFWKKQRWLAW